MDEIISRVASHLKQQGIRARVIQPSPAKPTALANAEKKIGLSFPDSLKEFYLRRSNGLIFYWERAHDMGFLRISSLADLVKEFKCWAEQILWMGEYDFPHVKDRRKACKTYAAMQSWLPLVQLNNGDCFCLDCASPEGAIVFHQHDWYDGGNGQNGHAIAPNLEALIARWGKVCFTSPADFDWPSTFGKNGIRWTTRYFDPKYIMAK